MANGDLLTLIMLVLATPDVDPAAIEDIFGIDFGAIVRNWAQEQQHAVLG